MRKLLLFAVALSGIATIGAVTSPAHAGLVNIAVDVSTDGGASFVPFITPTPPSPPTMYGPETNTFTGPGGASFSAELTAMSNFPGTPSVASLDTVGILVRNPTGTAGQIIFAVSEQGFSAPDAPPALTMTSTVGGALIPPDPPGSAVTLQSCVFLTNINSDNCLGGITGPVVVQPLLTTTSTSNHLSSSVTSLSVPYSIVEIIDLTLAENTSATFTAETTLAPTPTVPEPMSAALLASGLAGLALIRRRRKPA